ncbi:MAG: aspartate--tRNA ligase [Omnitrophica bacterium RBG_13_46_9]|nr:MAG: aspartate--tRNA ligase [Omnitrophica bacterium RBG_13_46_9]
MLRSHTCGELNAKHINEEVTLAGWVHARRDHGEIIFIDIRDAYGITQLVFDPKDSRDIHKEAHELKSEYVIRINGLVRRRPSGTDNPKLPTGDIEIVVRGLTVLNPSLTPPFEINQSAVVSDETRLKYRYIDLRKPYMQENIRLRHRINSIFRNFLEKRHFVEIETPFLTKSTPEGARDYLVPSRLNMGKFYALPQSPQLFKQILMVSGFDRYFQIVRCFRDEDLRKDRQPEFTQLDVEMSFIDEDDIFELSEGLIRGVFKNIPNIEMPTPFPRIKHREAMERFGTDKPDTRFGMEIVNLTDALKETKFKIFKNTLEKGGGIYAINAKGCAKYSLSKINGLIDKAKEYGAEGLAYFKCENAKLVSNIDKFFGDAEKESMRKTALAEDGDLMLIVAQKREIALGVLGSLRLDIARDRGMIDENKHSCLWVTDFPLFAYNEEDKRWVSEHHPFTACAEEDIRFLEDNKRYGAIRARSYDLVINGIEIASGSIRIHTREMQERIFKIIGLNDEEANKRFGFLLEAFKYGAPPHGGIAFGLDRFATIFINSNTIRDVIAFPKTQKAVCLMTDAPSDVDDSQLKELHIRKVT